MTITATASSMQAAASDRSELQSERLRAAKWFLVPMLIMLAAVAGWPLYRTIYFSFTDTTLNNLYGGKFIGFDNYLRWTTMKSGKVLWGGLLADPAWWNAVWNTVRFSFLSVTLETFFGMIVALVLNAEFKGRGLGARRHSGAMGHSDHRVGQNVELDAQRPVRHSQRSVRAAAYYQRADRLGGDVPRRP